MKGDGGPAFPTPYETRDGDTFSTCYEGGMTLRDYFAAKALPIAWQIFDQGYSPDEGSPENVAACAYQYADALIRERAK